MAPAPPPLWYQDAWDSTRRWIADFVHPDGGRRSSAPRRRRRKQTPSAQSPLQPIGNAPLTARAVKKLRREAKKKRQGGSQPASERVASGEGRRRDSSAVASTTETQHNSRKRERDNVDVERSPTAGTLTALQQRAARATEELNELRQENSKRRKLAADSLHSAAEDTSALGEIARKAQEEFAVSALEQERQIQKSKEEFRAEPGRAQTDQSSHCPLQSPQDGAKDSKFFFFRLQQLALESCS
jgi:hypothetical protein